MCLKQIGLLTVCGVVSVMLSITRVNGTSTVRDIKSTVESLFNKVTSEQVKQDSPFIPPLFWEKKRGTWESDVRFYFHGHEELFLMREAFRVYDDNMFATAWITSCLLESFRYGNAPKPLEDAVTAGVLAIEEYHDKNVNYSNSLMTFWPQKYNATYKAWSSYPYNLHHFFDLAASTNFSAFEQLLDRIGLQDIAEIMERLLRTEHGYLHAFQIPPDFDDTFVNLGLGSLLAEMKDEFPAAHAQWQSQNTNVTSVFDALKKYAYRPMSSDYNVNAIDCRTYFYLRYFLQKVPKDEDVMLVPTWIQNADEVKIWSSRGVDMPFNTNNVDVTVAANAVFGITTSILNGVIDSTVLDDTDIKQIYWNTSNLIASMIQTNFSSRHDLALLYYPSAIEFYWFVARTYGEITRKEKHGPLPHPILNDVKERLSEVLHDHMTTDLLNKAKNDSQGHLYYDDFVGDGDIDANNNTLVRGQDRLFTTGMAINALLSTWTVFDEQTKKLIWEKGTPTEVKDTVSKAAAFLQAYEFGLTYQPWNAFFSGSVKGHTTGVRYPMNRRTLIPGDKPQGYMTAVQGVIYEQEYQELIKKGVSGEPVPIDFHGYNDYPDYWPFWSSEPYTYVTNMLALAKYSNTYEE
ncbi:hypothetical protein MAR_005265 [Mya arenaria]|uniref:Uncharacterized protein n=1 Tax=Mya arenaria TaxID=6604 RepID=A0ABY7F0N4_MYAAR|nr:uncharacterized protein LOC128203254 [Mya arenaria]WAR15160.1 hypothetical protein MAR_005265 [Mya arenaria]